MGRYGTREDEIDDLLRRGVFVDLLRVVRNGIRTSRPGYGLKELEAFLDFDRAAEVKDGGTSIVVFERWMQTRDPALLAQIDEYNREDCIATLLLRDWLLRAAGRGDRAVRPVPAGRARGAEGAAERAGRARGARSARCSTPARSVAAHLLDYHRREGKPVWWWFFDAARDDAGGAARGRRVDRRPRARRRAGAGRRSGRRHTRFTFPAQELKLGARPGRPRPGDRQDRRRAARARPRAAAARAEARPVARGGRAAARADPGRAVPTPTRRRARSSASAVRCSRATAATRRSSRSCAASRSTATVQTTDLERDEGARPLARRPPPRDPGAARLGQDVDVGPADRRPDRAGKTVGVASTSHKAIHKLVDEVEAAAAERARLRGPEEGERGQPRVVLRGASTIDERRPTRTRAPASTSTGRHGVALRARAHDGDARLPLHRRGRPGVARRRARDGHVRRGTSSWSAIRSSSRR